MIMMVHLFATLRVIEGECVQVQQISAAGMFITSSHHVLTFPAFIATIAHYHISGL
jgi:hypothetical protein